MSISEAQIDAKIRSEKFIIKAIAAIVMLPLLLFNVGLFQFGMYALGAILLLINISLFRFIRSKHESARFDNREIFRQKLLKREKALPGLK